MSPKTGPAAGGTLLTISGNNFGNKDANVFIGDSVKKCVVSSSNNTVYVHRRSTSGSTFFLIFFVIIPTFSPVL